MTTVLFSHTAEPSGAELAVARLAIALHDAGHDVAVVFAQEGPLVPRLQSAGVRVAFLPGGFDGRSVTIQSGPVGKAKAAVQLARTGWAVGGVLHALNATVVVAESTKALAMGIVASRRARIPLVWHAHDRIAPDYFGALAPIVRFIGRWGAAGYLANSATTLATLATAHKPTAVCYPGVDLSAVSCPSNGGASATLDRACDTDPVRIVMVGRITEWKGQDLVLRAAEAMTAPLRLTFIGGAYFDTTEFPKRLARLISASALRKNVVLAGHVDEPAKFLADADILVHYSRLPEPFGQVIIEGMAAGVAVVAANAGGPTEIVTDGVDGLLVEPNSPAQLAAALQKLATDARLREHLASNGTRRAAAFTVAHSATVAVDLVDRVRRGNR